MNIVNRQRDWELILIEKAYGRIFGINISPKEYKELDGDFDLVKIGSKKGTIYSDEKLVPFIKKGSLIDDKIVDALKLKKCRYIPVILANEKRELKSLSDFAREQSTILNSRVYNCVKNWIESSKKEREQDVYEIIQKHRWRLQQKLRKEARDWAVVVNILISDVLDADENITILNLFEEFLGNTKEQKFQRNHSLEVSVLATLLGKKCGVSLEYLQHIAFSGLIHDIGIIIYEKKIKEILENDGMFLDPPLAEEYYQKHSIYSGLLLTRKSGDPIQGINKQVRDIVFQHEQKIDGTGPALFDKEFEEQLTAMGIDKKTKYYGYNIIPNDKTERKDLLDFWSAQDVVHKRIAGSKMLFGAQILQVAEYYVTELELQERKNIPEPHKKVVNNMISIAGSQLNGKVFEVFFNYLIPKLYFPDKLIVRVHFLSGVRTYEVGQLRGAYGIIHSIKGNEETLSKKVVIIFRNSRGTDLKQKTIIDLLDPELKTYLVIDDWNKYDKELYSKLDKELRDSDDSLNMLTKKK